MTLEYFRVIGRKSVDAVVTGSEFMDSSGEVENHGTHCETKLAVS